MTGNKILLTEQDIPTQWYNILPDLPAPLPPMLHPATREPVELPPVLFPKACLQQETSMNRWIDIPEAVRDIYRLWRPTPLFRATRLEKELKTPAKIFYKYEGVSPPGSHKPNTAVAQAYYAKQDGYQRITTETGAGQWGSSVAFGCSLFELDSTVYMVRASFFQKPYRRVLMETWGSEVFASPSKRTKSGKSILKKDPKSPGSLGIAISEAVEDALNHEEAIYSIGSVVNHVLLHQTVIGQEAKKQLTIVNEYPDIVAGCIGGGSSFSGLMWPFYHDTVSRKAPKEVEFLAVESTACPSVTKGKYLYDHGDTAQITPLIKMHTLGHMFIPPPIHAGGLRYHGIAPTLSVLNAEGVVNTRAYTQTEAFDAAMLFAKTEGILSAPEPAHGIKAAIDEALKCKETGEEKTILFLLCGHGHFDMQAYEDYLNKKLPPFEYPEEKVDAAMQELQRMYSWQAD
jgi:tryptophan synthase beta chain